MRNRNICVNGIGAAIALAAVSASGQSWNVGAGDWATGGNWNPATGAGGPTGVTHIRNGGTATISGAVNNPSHLAVGRDGVGTMTHNGGGTITTAWLQAGWGYGQTSTGTINIPSGTINTTASWNQFGASRSGDANNSIGPFANPDSTGIVNITGGALNLNAGGGGRNWFGFTRGTTTGNGSGTLHVSSGSFFTNSPTGIGFDENAGSSIAAGVVHQTGGTISFNSWISSGTRDQGRATFNIEGGTFNANSEFSLGELAGGQGTFSLSNNAVANINNFHVGRSGSTGTVNVNGGTLNLTGSTQIGGYQNNGHGNLNQTGGAVNFNGSWFEIVQDTGGVGTYTMSGGTFTKSTGSGALVVGSRGAGTMEQSGGSVTSNAIIVGGSWENQGAVANYIQTGGTVTTTSLLVGQNNSTATYSLEGGTLAANAITINAGDTFNWGTATLTTRDNGAVGTFDYSDGAVGSPIQSGTTLAVTGSLDTGSLGGTGNSTLDLGGLFTNSGTRFNQLTLTGSLDLDSGGDTLVSIDNPYSLRPNIGTAIDFGSLTLVDAAGGITGTFDTFVAPANDNIGWSEFTGVFSSASALPKNTWYLEYTNDGGAEQIIFHYKVEGTVPEPGTLGLLALGVCFIRSVRRRF